MHRLRHCTKSSQWRAAFPLLMRKWDSLPQHVTAFGLFSEPLGWRQWQAQLDQTSLPVLSRSDCQHPTVFYTDGACLYPRHRIVRVAAAAVLLAHDDGSFEVSWHGMLPGSCQSIFRAELLAVACAVSLAYKPVVFTDSKSVWRVANRILGQLRCGTSPVLPADHKDLWAFFLSAARGAHIESIQVHWIKGHVQYRSVTGIQRVHAWFNHWADLAAKQALRGHFSPLFEHVCNAFFSELRLAKDLFSYQAGVAMLFANEHDAPVVRTPVSVGPMHLVGEPVALSFGAELHPAVCHQGFANSLINWMKTIRWSSSSIVQGVGSLHDTSWIELFWGYVHDTATLPAFLHFHEWVWVQDDPTLEFAIPSFVTLFRTWKRTFDAILRAGVAVPWSRRLLKVKSVRALGARFDCPGFDGRVLSGNGALQALASQFAFCSRLSALRVPALN